MSNFYGGKQGFSFFIAKTYVLEQLSTGEYQEDENTFESIENFLEEKFNEDTDVHYNDYVLLSIGIQGFDFFATDKHHGNLYRKDISNFKLVGNLSGPPGGTSEVTPLSWANIEKEWEEDSKKTDYSVTPSKEGELVLDAIDLDSVSGQTHSNIKIKYYFLKKNNEHTSRLKIAIQVPAPYIDLASFYYPEDSGISPQVHMLDKQDLDDSLKNNLFYNKYEYPLITKYYKPRIENDELYGDLYTYQPLVDNPNRYEYQNNGNEDKTLYLGKIKQESGILIGKNISYYIMASEANQQTDTDLADYLSTKEKRDTLKTEKDSDYVLLTNKKVICLKLNDDFPCGLGYVYASETDHSKRVSSNVDLVGKIVTYGDETGPTENDKVISWFFAYDFSRDEDSDTGNIVPDWYYLSLYSVETKIIFAEDENDSSGDPIGPDTSEEIKVGDLWVGIEDSPSISKEG